MNGSTGQARALTSHSAAVLLAAAAPDIVFLFAGAGVLLYVAARAAADAITDAADPSPAHLALAHWMPIAVTALLAACTGQNDIAVTIPFAASVAALGLVLGTLILMSTPLTDIPPHAIVWPFIMPVALLALMAGFRGTLTWWHAVMMVALGTTVLSVWRAAPDEDSSPAQMTEAKAGRYVQLLMAIAIAGIGAWVALRGGRLADDRTRIATAGLIATAVIAPLLTLPLLGATAFAAQQGRIGSAMSTIVALVLLNLCLLVPLVIVTAYLRSLIITVHGGARDFDTIVGQLRAVHMPIAVWRVDTVLIMIGGLLLVPVSLSRWTLHKSEGVAMTLAYIAYVIVSAAIAIRS
jgi:hypothetical protein